MITKKTGRRGRPREFDRDKGLAQAKVLFHQRGYDGVGVAELSQIMGIRPPSLYAAFGSKRQLFEQVLKIYVAEEGEWLPEILAADHLLENTLAHLLERACEIYTRDPSQPGCLVLDGTRNCTDAQACELGAQFRQGTWQILHDRIAQECPDQASVLASYTLTLMMGLSAAAREGRSRSELQAIAQIAAEGATACIRRSAADKSQRQETRT